MHHTPPAALVAGCGHVLAAHAVDVVGEGEHHKLLHHVGPNVFHVIIRSIPGNTYILVQDIEHG